MVDRHVDHLPGWLMVIGGAVLLGFAVLLPPWLETRELNWQRDVMRLQQARLAQQEANYVQFSQALAADEPSVVSRLAFAHLRLKPAGATPVGVAIPDPVAGYTIRYVADPDDALACAIFVRQCLDQPGAATVDAWLHVPMPRLGEDYLPLAQPQGRLARLVNGRGRMPLAAVGLVCIAVGLVPPTRIVI